MKTFEFRIIPNKNDINYLVQRKFVFLKILVIWKTEKETVYGFGGSYRYPNRFNSRESARKYIDKLVALERNVLEYEKKLENHRNEEFEYIKK